MKIIRDTREQAPFTFGGYDCEVQAGTLPTGDYSLAGLVDRCAVERKSLDDLLGCLTGEGRDRFERELARARGLDAFAVVIEAGFQDMAEGRYRSRMKPHAALQSVLAFQVRYGVPFIWAGTRTGAEYTAYHFLRHYLREASARYERIIKAHGASGVAEKAVADQYARTRTRDASGNGQNTTRQRYFS